MRTRGRWEGGGARTAKEADSNLIIITMPTRPWLVQHASGKMEDCAMRSNHENDGTRLHLSLLARQEKLKFETGNIIDLFPTNKKIDQNNYILLKKSGFILNILRLPKINLGFYSKIYLCFKLHAHNITRKVTINA